MKKKYRMILLLFTFFWIPSGPAGAVTVQPASCADFINETLSSIVCGFVELPLNHNKPDRRTVTLPILIAQSTRSMLTPASRAILVPGAGGPGASIGFGFQYRRGEFLEPYQELLKAGFDVVILDQRGAGMSTPRLTCFEAIDTFKQLVTEEHTTKQIIESYRDSVRQCQSRLAHHGLEHFDTTQSAMDFLAVMAGLDYRWWGTIATSYATVIAQTMIALQSDIFNRVVLDSPVPLDFQKPITSESTYASIIKTVQRCRGMVACNNRYPELRKSLDHVLQRAAENGYNVTLNLYDNAHGNSLQTTIINDDTLLSIFANALYSNEGIATLPGVIANLSQGNTGALHPYIQDFWYQSTDEVYADGLNLSIHCKERQVLEEKYIRENPAYLATLSEETRQLLIAQRELCRTWSIPSRKEPVKTESFNVPTVFLAGSLDPVISDIDIAHTVDNFALIVSNTKVSGAGHAVWFQSNCVRRAVVEFFDNGSTDLLPRCELEIPRFK